MFRRNSIEAPAPIEAASLKGSGKGRPTPSRKESEAAAKARAKVPRTRKEQAAAARGSRGQSTAQVRAAMRSGDERFLPARDKGPVRRFIRDFVDARLSFVELMIPVLIVSTILGYSGHPNLARIGNTILLTSVLLMMFDIAFLRWRMRRELTARFPDASLKGTTYYALVRAVQLRFMRLPKSQVKIGAELPEHYR